MIPVVILAIENDEDKEFMISIYVEFYPLMKSTAYKIIKNDTTAEDIVQEAIIMLIRKLGMIREYDHRRLVSYIIRTVRNLSINCYNKQAKEKAHTFYSKENDFLESIQDDASTPSERFEILEEYEELGKAMKLLPEKERDILYMKYNMEMSDQMIGKIMGIKTESVRQYLTRARRNAKRYITKEGAAIE